VVPDADPEMTPVGVALALVVVDTSTDSALLLLLLSLPLLVFSLSRTQYVSFLYSSSGHVTSGFRRLSSSTVIFHCLAKDSHVSPGFEATPKPPLQSEARDGARRDRLARRRVERMVVGWRVGGGDGGGVVMRWEGEVERMRGGRER
jgi:hypothetical protein